MFAEKLDFFMKLTGAQNSALGRAAHVDASTVSRLRAGKRELPKKQNFLPAMCDYFARNISSDYQKRSASDTICAGQKWPEDRERASAMIYAWLAEENPAEDRRISRLVSGIAGFSFKTPCEPMENCAAESALPTGSYYFGNAGKREAVERFLRAVIAAEKPRTLSLYSDESMQWLNEDPVFARRWANLMRGAIQNGNRIRIIHTIGRTLDEMLEALGKWMGVYMTGAVEPYYCPRLRDGITRRTLFVAPDLAAVTASSVGDGARGALNQYITEPSALKALAVEFQRYLDLCLPLMRILTRDETSAAHGLLTELLSAEGDAVIAQTAPSLGSMPEAVARSIAARSGGEAFLAQWAEAVCALQKNLSDARVFEMIPLYTEADFTLGGAPASALCALNGRGVFYTRAEYAAHLDGVAKLLAAQENYRAVLLEAPFLPNNMALCNKKRAGTILARTDEHRIVFAINEPNMTAAFDEYLMRQAAGTAKPGHRSGSVKRLCRAAELLRGWARRDERGAGQTQIGL